ncbi:unnamed protein product [Symbiodinium sp. CCMP2592]|nr:unnamed protein product [Symbiodinium sp. CCMP2592]
MSPALRHGIRAYTTLQATALHESVPPDRWCITRADLKYLGEEVWKAILSGEIQQPDDGSDDFQVLDTTYGPSIYTVNKQHIMPVTEKYGKVSWALLLHPDGLDCDIFISHAWQEGVFEFLSKVLHSWPVDARHAWCCMLANPQNLDIGSLLQSPISSPFALALKASKYVLVVPNHRGSIYTRLWCGYEAYRAQEEGRTIILARASNHQQLAFALLQVFLAGLVGLLSGWMLLSYSGWQVPLLLSVAVGAVSISATINHDISRKALNLIGALTCGIICANWRTLSSTCLYSSASLPFVGQRQRVISTLSFFLSVFLEVDRANGKARMGEARQLSHGYEGIRHARCSQQADADRIFQEIGKRIEEVDHAIHVLLLAGMSSATLREMSRRGFDIRDAGYAEIAVPCAAMVPGGLLTLWTLTIEIMNENGLFPAWTVLLLTRIAILVVLWFSPRDERCFILKMMAKVLALYFGLACPLLLVWQYFDGASPSCTAPPSWTALALTVYLFILGLASLGMRRLADLPFCGPCLLQLILARGRRVFSGAIQPDSQFASDTDPSDSSDDSSR